MTFGVYKYKDKNSQILKYYLIRQSLTAFIKL